MAASTTFLYVGNAGTRDISAFSMSGHEGRLTPIGTFAVPGPVEACFSSPLAVSRDKRFLFFALRNQPWSIRSFSIDSESGRLDYLGAGPLADNTCYLSTDTSGRFLLSASYHGNKLSVNAIGLDGIVGPILQTIDTEPKSHSILVDSAGRFALSACLGADKLYQWKFDAQTGFLSPNDPPFVSVKQGYGPRHFAFHPSESHVYALNELSGSICVFAYDRSRGVLTQMQEADIWSPRPDRKVSAADIHMTPDGRFLYASGRGASELAVFRVAPDGETITLVDRVATEPSPRGFAIDPSGRFLYAAGQLSNQIAAYSIDTGSGRLTKIAAYPVGETPNWIEIVRAP